MVLCEVPVAFDTVSTVSWISRARILNAKDTQSPCNVLVVVRKSSMYFIVMPLCICHKHFMMRMYHAKGKIPEPAALAASKGAQRNSKSFSSPHRTGNTLTEFSAGSRATV